MDSFSRIKAKAEEGDAQSQYDLGFAYEFGFGVIRDKEKSFGWYRRAAEQDLADAQVAVADYYSIEKSYEIAVEWYRKANENGYAKGALDLGFAYHYGLGVNRDFEKAELFYLENKYSGENQGTGWVESLLGDLYSDPENPCKDEEQAFHSYLEAADLGYDDAKDNLAKFTKMADYLEIDLSMYLE